MPLASSVAPPAPTPTVDVELAAVIPTKQQSLGGLSRRDTLMLLVGAGFLAAAGGTALVLKRVRARKNTQTEQEEQKEK